MFTKFMKKKVPVSDLDKKIADILFPEYNEMTDEEGNKWVVDYSVTSNLEAVIIDIAEGRADEVCVETLNEVYRKLAEVERLLKIERKIKSTGNVNYMVSP